MIAIRVNTSSQMKPVYPLGIGIEQIQYVELEQGECLPEHETTAQKYCLCLTIGGEGRIHADNSTITAMGDSFVLLRPEHKLSCVCSGDTWTFWWMEFSSREIRLEMGLSLPVIATARVHFILEQGMQLYRDSEWKGAAGMWSAAIGLLCDGIDRNQRDNGIPAAAEKYIRKNLNTVTVAGLCDHLQIGDRTLRNIFHRAFQTSPKRYILRIRMELARNYLKETDMSISAIASKLGFANPFHFSGSFKSFYEISPSEYRRNAQRNRENPQ